MASLTTDAPFVFSAGMAMPAAEAGPLRSGGPLGSDSSGSGFTAASSADELVRETRREIAEIVREVAGLARQQLDRPHFFAALIDRTVRALAAEGAVVWDLSGPRPLAVVRTGRVTDQQITASGRPAHERMLAEVVASGSPVVVPPTPIPDDPPAPILADSAAGEDAAATPLPHARSDQLQLPANPTDRPAAVVPILDPLESAGESAAGSRYVLEVFLEPEAGIATQRGYLRFTAQMADLAGDFLRLDEIRRGRAAARLDAQLGEILPRLHRHDTLSACAAEIVDSAAELLDCARVTLVQVGRGSADGAAEGRAGARGARILAISHVEAIDHRGAACGRLLEQILSYALPQGRPIWLPVPTPAAVVADHSAQSTAPAMDAPLFPVAVIALGDGHRYRLFLQSVWPAALDESRQRVAERFAVHAQAALRSAQRLQSVPFARLWLACLPAAAGPAARIDLAVRIRRLILPALALLALAMLGMMPQPMRVSLPATLRPESVRTHYAPADAIVQEVLVRHGQQVTSGQPMLLLRDIALDEQTTTLIGRRAVVGEKLARVLASLVQAPSGGTSSRPDAAQASDDALVQQQRLLEEEMRGIEQQLQLLADARERLVLRSDRDGRVDAWQTERLALGRPVRTGEPLLRVQPLLPRWVADARIPQNRAQIIFAALDNPADDAVVVRLDAAQASGVTGHYVRHTGFEQSAAGGPATALVEFLVELPQDSAVATRWQSGAPVEVAIDCGTLPLAHVLFFDFVRSIRLQWARWS